MQTVLYLHGFLSGPGSKKACVLRDLCEAEGANYVAPDLNMSPEDAAALIWSEYEKAAAVGTVAVAGASLGGFYAAWLAGRTGIRAVLLNPRSNLGISSSSITVSTSRLRATRSCA